MVADLDRSAVRGEMEQARQDLHRLLGNAAPADLARPSAGTKWTNQQLLFHMLFGYLITRALLPLVRVFARLPDGASRAFAALLDSASRPFHVITIWLACSTSTSSIEVSGSRTSPWRCSRSGASTGSRCVSAPTRRERFSMNTQAVLV